MGTGSPVSVCPECDVVQREPPIPSRARVLCARCGALLYRHVPRGIERALAYGVTAAVAFVIANVAPVLTLETRGDRLSTTVGQTAAALRNQHLTVLAALVLITALLMPAVEIVVTLYLLGAVRFPTWPRPFGALLKVLHAVRPWSMVDVFVLGTLAALARFSALAHVALGWGFWALGALMMAMAAIPTGFDVRELSARVTGPPARRSRCACCGAGVHAPKPHSLSRTWALVLAAVVLYFPANLLPVLETSMPGGAQRDTILSGVVSLWDSGVWPVAVVLLVASIVIPIVKLLALAFLLFSVGCGWRQARLQRARLYRLIARIGRWSMTDIFVAALVARLVQFPGAATARVGPGAVAFAAVVVLTMFATDAFDPRLIWGAPQAAR
jgi:paraquat-inducible protein A